MFLVEYQILMWISSSSMVSLQPEDGDYVTDNSTISIFVPPSDFDNKISSVPRSNYQYQEKFCHCLNACSSIDIVLDEHRNFPNQTCMCDEFCSIYDDCCFDTKHQNEYKFNFICQRTSYDGNVYVKNACGSNSVNMISTYCMHSTNNTKDILFPMIPVTSEDTNITYSNFFCALCNNDKKFRFWDIVITPSILAAPIKSEINETLLNDKHFWELLSTGSFDKYTVHTKIPDTLLSDVEYCIPNDVQRCLREAIDVCFNTSCNISNEEILHYQRCIMKISDVRSNVSAVKASNIPFHYCEDITSDNAAYDMFCRNHERKPDEADEFTYIDFCFNQTTDGKLCLINNFFKSDEFVLMDDKTVYVHKFRSNFTNGEWFMKSNSSIYLCGTELPQSKLENLFTNMCKVLSIILISISIIFLVVFVIRYITIEKVRYPFSRVILSYSITLLITFITYLMTNWVSSCTVIAALQHYLLLSCFTWLVIASYECWRTVTASTGMRSRREHTLRRFGVYCFIGWIFPTSILSVAIYFELSSIQSVPCALKPGYGRMNQCFIAQLLPSYYFFHYPSGIMFLINICFFIRIIIYVISNSSNHRNFCIFTKLALVTGIPWTIGTLVTLTNGYLIRLIYVILNSSQGIFIFFIFAYDKENFKDRFNTIHHYCFKKRNEHKSDRSTVIYSSEN